MSAATTDSVRSTAPGSSPSVGELVQAFNAAACDALEASSKSSRNKRTGVAARAIAAAAEEAHERAARVADPQARLERVLSVELATIAANLDVRNRIWPYEYMAFSRRVGALWESLVRRCFEHAPREDFELAEAPGAFSTLYAERVSGLMADLQAAGGSELAERFRSISEFVDPSAVNLALDEHCRVGGVPYHIDLKLSFGSNEKGNCSRLMEVGRAYHGFVEGEQRCLVLVARGEDATNHYFKKLANSGYWDARVGSKAYAHIHELTGFDLRAWIDAHVDWKALLSPETYEHFDEQDLLGYLEW